MDEDEEINADFRLYETNIIMHSAEAGITGVAVEQKGQAIIAPYGQSDKRFSQDVDNYMNIGEIYNIVVGPLVDIKGNIRGVIHLVNKEDSNGNTQITDDDRKEINGLLPILGEIIRTADEASEISEMSCCKNL